MTYVLSRRRQLCDEKLPTPGQVPLSVDGNFSGEQQKVKAKNVIQNMA